MKTSTGIITAALLCIVLHGAALSAHNGAEELLHGAAQSAQEAAGELLHGATPAARVAAEREMPETDAGLRSHIRETKRRALAGRRGPTVQRPRDPFRLLTGHVRSVPGPIRDDERDGDRHHGQAAEEEPAFDPEVTPEPLDVGDEVMGGIFG